MPYTSLLHLRIISPYPIVACVTTVKYATSSAEFKLYDLSNVK
jgi:hypothetical protein